MKNISTLIICCYVVSGTAQTAQIALLTEDISLGTDITFFDEMSYKTGIISGITSSNAFIPVTAATPVLDHVSSLGIKSEESIDFKPVRALMFNDNLPFHLESEFFTGGVIAATDPVPELSSGFTIPYKDFKLGNLVIRSGLMLTSGFCDATSEVLKIKYEQFEKVFPGSNDQFWDYKISWSNKYKEGNPPQPRFPGSKNVLVWTTDGYHLMRMMRNVTMIAAMTIPLKGGIYKNWRYYVLEGIVYYISYTTGFNLAYDVVFN